MLIFIFTTFQVKERQRIKDVGGFISFNGVWRVAGVLATSRALGDYPLKDTKMVIAEPDILTFNLRFLQPYFMILASDGLWDVFSNQEAVDFVKGHLNEPFFGAKSLVLQAYYKGSLDNISVVVVNFSSDGISRYSSKQSWLIFFFLFLSFVVPVIREITLAIIFFLLSLDFRIYTRMKTASLCICLRQNNTQKFLWVSSIVIYSPQKCMLFHKTT